ncbi:hypothetical protein [Glaesserella parasuis]|nr:hypothetical protein [Glaesserella parasuis]MDP0299426.1 hypothetical protein [Glaesserella parasuis]
MFLKHFSQILNDNISGDGEGWTIVDVFGGSGLLSHTAKQLKPQARVIYNDFDHYAERLRYIPDINQLRQQLAVALADCPKGKRLDKTKKLQLIGIIEAFKGYKDLHVLCSWLLFSGEQVKNIEDLYKHNFWHCLRQSNYPSADGYLEGVEIVCESFHQLVPRFSGKEKVLLVLDPPYLFTRQESYRQEKYFDLIDFLRLINITKPPYIFFSSKESEFIRFIEYMQEDKVDNWQAFDGVERIVVSVSVSCDKKYEDNMVYKF